MGFVHDQPVEGRACIVRHAACRVGKLLVTARTSSRFTIRSDCLHFRVRCGDQDIDCIQRLGRPLPRVVSANPQPRRRTADFVKPLLHETVVHEHERCLGGLLGRHALLGVGEAQCNHDHRLALPITLKG
eukprot:3467667-Prymnesium_polylepis.1